MSFGQLTVWQRWIRLSEDFEKKKHFWRRCCNWQPRFFEKIKLFFCSVFSYKEKEDSFKVVSNFCQSANNLQTSKWSKFSVFAEKWLSAVRQVLLNNFAWNVTKLTTVADHKFSTFQHRFVRHLKAATKHFNQISSQGYSGPEKQATALKSPYTCCACCSKMLQLKPFAWADN